MTNYDRIRNMSIEEMAEFITEQPSFCGMVNGIDCNYGWNGGDCINHAKQWLESEVQNDQ